MVIGFNPQFKDLILQGTKIHTIREDKNHRWKPGMTMHMATGVRTKNYKQFAEKICTGVAYIEFKWRHINPGMANEDWAVQVRINDIDVVGLDGIIDQLARNDGFMDRASFIRWPAWYKKNFTGKIIHWTDKRYI